MQAATLKSVPSPLAEPQRAVIRMRGITKVYDTGSVRVEALKVVDVDVNEGDFIAIVGPSGSGKSTLMNLIGCLDTPTKGSYLLNEKQVSQMNDNELARIRAAHPADPELQAPFAEAQRMRSAAAAKLDAAYQAALTRLESGPRPANRIDLEEPGRLASKARGDLEGTPHAEPNAARADALYERWQAELAADRAAREAKYRALSAVADAEWPAIAASIKAEDGFHLWSDTFDRVIDDIFAVQDDIAKAVSTALHVTLLGRERATAPGNPEAYARTLEANARLQIVTEESVALAIVLFREAIELDPQDARAWSGLARAHLMRALYIGSVAHEHREARRAVEKALALDDQFAEAHETLSIILASFEFRLTEAGVGVAATGRVSISSFSAPVPEPVLKGGA